LRDLTAIESVDLEDDMPHVRAPTLLLGADEDVITPLSASPSGIGMTDLERLIPNARLEVLEGCGHFITIERPEDTAARIADWVLAA